jgi:hypothetical protein
VVLPFFAARDDLWLLPLRLAMVGILEIFSTVISCRLPIEIMKIPIHLIRFGMNRIAGLVSLTHDKNAEIVTIRNPNTVQEV